MTGSGPSGDAARERHDPDSRPIRLERGAGRGALLFLDTSSGIAGDMLVAALVDLGVPEDVVREAVDALGVPGLQLHFADARDGAIGATSFEVRVAEAQPERPYAVVDELIASAGALREPVRALARRVFGLLARAESRVHRMPVSAVHFHEVGAVDSIVDIVACAAALEHVGARVLVSPLPMGRGFTDSRHGRLPLPAPATVECLRGVPTYDAGIDGELVTPTGAAIVACVADGFPRWPRLAPTRVGWGKGSRRWPDRPNVLRAVLGDALPRASSVGKTHVIVEANVDDITGELAAHAVDALLAAGAADAWAEPIVAKKGRPALVLCALTEAASADRVATVMLSETSTIGVRSHPVSRTERPRRVVDVATKFGPIPVKVSEGPYGPAQLKPEFDACAHAARAAGVPVREVIADAVVAARRALI